MSDEQHNPERRGLAVFTVCADGELARIAQQPLPGIEFAGAFEEYITTNRRPHFPQVVKRASAGVAFIDFDRCIDQAIETAAALKKIPSLQILTVGVSSRVDTDLLLRAMRAGCSEFLGKPVEAAKFEEILERLEGRIAPPDASSSSRGQVVSLFGAKGGVGTTTLAVHLAVALATGYGKKTLLIDHHQLGHVCLYLGLKESQYHFDQLIRNVERLDTPLLKGFVAHHSSGLDVLPSSDACAVDYRSSSQEMEQVLEFLRREYDYILIDSCFAYGEITAATIQFSDQLYLVTTPDVAALRDLARHAANYSLKEVAAGKGRIIVNRATAQDAIGTEHIEKAVGFAIALRAPNNYAELVRAINAGEPIPAERHTDFTMQIAKWAELVAGGGGESIAMIGALKRKFAFWR